MTNISIIIPAGSRNAMLRWCVKTIRENSINSNHEIIIGFDRIRVMKDMSKPIETQPESIIKWHELPSKELLDFLESYGCKCYDLGELGDHYRDTNACVRYCSNEWMNFMHNDIYCAKNWDLGIMNAIENGFAQGDDIIIPNSLPDHAQPAGIAHQTVIDIFKSDFISSQEKEIHTFNSIKVEEFIRQYSKPGQYFKEFERNKSWVCPITIKKSTFVKVGMYPVKEPFPFGNDLILDRAITDIAHGNKIVPLDSFIWHL